MIGHLECEEPLQVRVSYDSGHESVEVYIRFSGCAGCLVGQVEHFKGRGFYFKCKTYQTELTVLAVLEIYFFCVDNKPTSCHFCVILYFSFTSCSTCFGQPCAHLQELTTA